MDEKSQSMEDKPKKNRVFHVVLIIILLLAFLSGCLCTSGIYVYLEEKSQTELNTNLKNEAKLYKDILVDAGEYVVVTPDKNENSIRFYVEKTTIQQNQIKKNKQKLEDYIDKNKFSFAKNINLTRNLLEGSKEMESIISDNSNFGVQTQELLINNLNNQLGKNYYQEIYFQPEKLKEKLIKLNENTIQLVKVISEIKFSSSSYKEYAISLSKVFEYESTMYNNLYKALEKNDIAEFETIMSGSNQIYETHSDEEDKLNDIILKHKSKILSLFQSLK